MGAGVRQLGGDSQIGVEGLAVRGGQLTYTLQWALDRFSFGLNLVLDAIDARIPP